MVYKKPLYGPKSLGKKSKNGDGLVLKVGCDIKIKNSHENQIHQ
jgi:hypothetical protein